MQHLRFIYFFTILAVYEKVKGNNHALAKALSEEKQAYQSLFSENLALTSQVQELEVACSMRNVSKCCVR